MRLVVSDARAIQEVDVAAFQQRISTSLGRRFANPEVWNCVV
jgi:hypothetical protein